jgi:hypothetical protein
LIVSLAKAFGNAMREMQPAGGGGFPLKLNGLKTKNKSFIPQERAMRKSVRLTGGRAKSPWLQGNSGV